MALTIIFCKVDDFCKIYLKNAQRCALPNYEKGSRKRERNMTLSEIMSLHIYYAACSHKYKTFKAFYECRYAELLSAFPKLVSYERAIELKEEILVPLVMFFLSILSGCTGITYGDSTAIKACHIKRAYAHSTLRDIARFGKTTNGWFYGTKLHLFLNEYSQIIACLLTPGNVSDNNHDLLRKMRTKLWGKLFGDKGYIITPEFWEELYEAGLQVIHGLRSNMANKMMTMEDKLLHRRRANVSEGGFSMLKDRMSLEYTRVRSLYGYFCNIIIMLISYQFWASVRADKFKARNTKPRMAKKKQIRITVDPKSALLAIS
jgi:hypothetical protein